MTGKRSFAWIGILLLGALLTGVFVRVLDMRLGKGDIYPHYASFRTDPLGASGLFESYDRLPEFAVEKNSEHLMRIRGLDGDTALFVLGLPRTQYSGIRIPDRSPVLKAMQEEGTRLVITLDPTIVPFDHRATFSEDEERWLERRRKLREERKKKLQDAEESGKDGESEVPDEDVDLELERIKTLGPRLQDKFGAPLADVPSFERPEEGWEAVAGESIQPAGITRAIPVWKSQYRFELDADHEDDWKVVASVDGQPVVVERKVGKGSLVIATDSYFASNEALYAGGDSEFLLWLTGGKKRLIFDETLHGSVETGGVVKVMRQFRLHGFLIGVIIFILLWAWRSASSLSPGNEAIERGIVSAGGTVSGRDSQSGFVRLLRRSIPGDRLIENCVASWKQSQIRQLPPEKGEELEIITQQHRRNPREFTAVEAYRKISRLLTRR